MRKISKSDLAYEFILNNIKSGQYGPGYRLVISEVAKELGISTIPVREAINKLAFNGVVELNQNSSAVISTINKRKYEEIMRSLAVMEGYATSVAAAQLSEKQLEKLEELNKSMEVAISDWEFETFSQINQQFHMMIIEACGNIFLINSIKRAWKQLDLVRQQFSVPKRAPESIKEHDVLISMIKQDAPTHDIETYSRMHKLNTLHAFLRQDQKE